MEIQEEYMRIKKLFEGIDESQLKLIDGALWEAARIRKELDDLHAIAKESGLIKVHPTKPGLQKELPVSKLLVKARANYLNYVSKLAAILGKSIDDEEDDLSTYE